MSSKARRRRRQPPRASSQSQSPQPADNPSQVLDAVEVLAFLADARDRSADILDLTKEECEASRTETTAQAEACLAAARAQATRVCEEAERRAREIQERAREASSAVAAGAADQAAATKEAADREASQVLTAAEAEGRRLVEEATTRALATHETSQVHAEQVLADAQMQADQLRRAAQRDADQANSRLRNAEAEAKRIRQEAADADTERRRQSALDIKADRERAARDAEELRSAAAATVASAEKRAADLMEQATNRQTAAMEKNEEADRLLAEAKKTWERARSRPARRQERKRVRQQGRHQRATARREHKQAKGRPTLTYRLGQIRRWLRELVRNQARRVLVTGPILAPMAVAWWSQTEYAKDAFGWWTVFALGFAAAWELTTAFTGWMYHQARQQGDSGTIYRIMTWVFASGAAAMNYAHHCGPGGRPTQASVAFATMSVVGMVLWELYASLVHRQYLREQGLVSRARPKIGLIRWIRFPVRSWTAWSLTIENASLSTLERAWNAASIELADRNALRSGTALHRIVIPHVPLAGLYDGAGPATAPLFRPIGNAPNGTGTGAWAHWNGTRRTPLPPAGAHTGGTDRNDNLVPLGHPSTDQDSSSVPFRSAPPAGSPGGASGTGTQRAPGAATPEGRTAERGGTEPAAKRHTPGGTENAERNERNGRERTSGAEREGEEMVLEDKERAAVERLVARNQPLSKRSISDEVRSNGDTIADERALKIANYLNAKAKSQLGQHLAGV
ncbi:hypothetical protein ABZS96_20815 [Streptomyces avermitilis]|uniref:hypothetical protein n=1 Tax=Streptomyces avermitilis TaxID=33903 RepID=UPI0033B85DF7